MQQAKKINNTIKPYMHLRSINYTTIVYVYITQYGSTVYIGIAMGCPIHKDILVFTFSFNLNLSFKDIKVKNM